ncbi:hypothetical protein PHYBOEH_007002 [Phytophthora boehmeriae]|uniref:Uncharacterized protein n=1 Tax=Phytophthora boehmeriae TaxID=109152 RepID=A0A8T1X2Z1_9STRA|nr:hypothetical protein PHYBOEH_007002 [Phytophthora boehmeriae]
MRSMLLRFRRSLPSPSSSNPAMSSPIDPSDSAHSRGSLFRRSSAKAEGLLQRVFVPKAECESPNRGRKRDRLRDYLTRRRINAAKGETPYLWPVDVPRDQDDEVRSSDETEEGDEMYVVDYFSDSDSDEESLVDDKDNYVEPPVVIPEMYRRQDRLGGITVAGARVLFTYAGFKRRQMLSTKLKGVPELDEVHCGQQWGCTVIEAF